MRRTISAIIVLAVGSSGLAQPQYEIGYQFDCEPAVVRREAYPFAVEAQSQVGWHWLSIQFAETMEPIVGLASMSGRVFKMPQRHPDLMARGWTEVVYDDLVFSSVSDEPVSVDLDFFCAQSSMSFGGSRSSPAFRFELIIDIAGDARTGVFEGTVQPDAGLDRQYTGFLSGELPDDRIETIEGFTVPVNMPVRLRVRSTRTISVPADDTAVNQRFDTLWPGNGFPLDTDVFSLPAGVSVSSRQAGIRDNRLVLCWADYDLDGELTIFDFLAFQNLFDAGDLTADFDLDGTLTIFDFLAFQNAFDAGCP